MKVIINMLRYILSNLCILLLLSIEVYSNNRVDTIRSILKNPKSTEVLVTAHRGDWRNYCENSIDGINSAINMGVDIVEIDVALTKDSVLILMHDKTLDRTTTGKGNVSDFTLKEIKNLYLKNGAGIKTQNKIPTFEEVLLETKGKVIFDIDKADNCLEQVYSILKKTNTLDMALVVTSLSPQELEDKFSKYFNDIIFMPNINLDENNVEDKIKEYIEVLNPIIMQFKYAYDTNKLPLKINEKYSGKFRIWYNTLWNTHAGGHDDDCSLKDPNKGYGYLIDTLGATNIQTDRPQYLLQYLRNRGQHR